MTNGIVPDNEISPDTKADVRPSAKPGKWSTEKKAGVALGGLLLVDLAWNLMPESIKWRLACKIDNPNPPPALVIPEPTVPLANIEQHTAKYSWTTNGNRITYLNDEKTKFTYEGYVDGNHVEATVSEVPGENITVSIGGHTVDLSALPKTQESDFAAFIDSRLRAHEFEKDWAYISTHNGHFPGTSASEGLGQNMDQFQMWKGNNVQDFHASGAASADMGLHIDHSTVEQISGFLSRALGPHSGIGHAVEHTFPGFYDHLFAGAEAVGSVVGHSTVLRVALTAAAVMPGIWIGNQQLKQIAGVRQELPTPEEARESVEKACERGVKAFNRAAKIGPAP